MREFRYVGDFCGILRKNTNYNTIGMSTFCKYPFLSLLAVICLGCNDPVNPEGGSEDKTPEGESVRVTIRPERDSLVRNPLNGWVMYLGRSWDENFWTNPDSGYSPYDAMPTSEGTVVKVSDYASTAYLRTSWAALNPSEDEYIWKDKDHRITKMLQSCLDRGLRLAFRIVIDGRDQGQNTPTYVFDAGAEYFTSGNGIKSPYPEDPVFQAKYEKFLTAFAEEFNDPDKVDFIDGFSLGKWGEAHALIFKDNSNKMPVFVWKTSLYSRLFTRVPLFVNYHRTLGDWNQNSWSDTPNKDTESMIESAVQKGYSLRHDAFGMYTYYRDWEKQIAAKYNYKRPIAMEGGWITDGTHRYWIYDLEKEHGLLEGQPGTVRQAEYDMSREARVNLMDFRVHAEIESFFRDSYNLVREFISAGGYRLCPVVVTVPDKVTPGQTLTVTTRWSNYGWGYCPNNIPQWNYKYKGAIALLDMSFRPVAVFVDDKIEPSEWKQNTPTDYSTEITLGDVAPGTYVWAVGIVDTTKGNVPGLNLAAASSRLTSDGWVKVNPVTVE